MPNSNRLTIDLRAIQNNLTHMMAKLPPKTRIMAMVKGNGYGTDLALLSQALIKMGVHCLGVAYVLEGVQLRERNITLPIFVIHADASEVQEVATYNLEAGVFDPSFCRLLNQEGVKQKKQVKVHLDVTTGMNRFGCRPENVLTLAQIIHSLPALDFEGIMTHFVAPEISTFDSFSNEQIKSFKKCVEELAQAGIHPPRIHASNTAAIRRFDLPFCTMVRIGIGLFQPENVLTLESRIASIHRCKQGESVGYLRGYRIRRDEERIAVISIGYHDGIDLRYSGKGYVLIHNKKAPMIGLICMDFMMVDVTDIPEAKIGDSVLIFGKELPIQTVAGWATPNIRELMTALGPRIERRFIHEELISAEISSQHIRNTTTPL